MELYLTEDKGWGVNAAETIKRGTFIVEYAGADPLKATIYAMLPVHMHHQSHMPMTCTTLAGVC